MTPYEPGTLTAVAMELDPDGRISSRLANKIERAAAGSHFAIAIETFSIMLAQALASAPPEARIAVADDVLDAIRHAVRKSLN